MTKHRTHPQWLYSCLVIFTLAACENVKLNDSTLAMQPYQEGDVLVFSDSEGFIDSLFISEINIQNSPSDPLDVFPTYYQSLRVTGQISQREIRMSTMNRPITRRRQSLLRIESSKSGDDQITFVFDNVNDSLRCPSTRIIASELEKSINQGEKEMNIKAEEIYDNMKGYDFDLLELTWNHRLGYTQLRYKDEYTVSLLDFIRNDKSIFN